jgi:hypothetical protein
MDPTICRIVVYHDPQFYDAPVPAIVSRVNSDGTIDLTAFPPGTDSSPRTGVSKATESYGPGWSWPERTP